MRPAGSRAPAVFAACLTLLAGAACAQREPVRIAVVGSTGAEQGANLAVKALMEQRGASGRPFQLSLVYDGGGSGERAIATAEAMAADPSILAVIGHASSTTSLAAAQSYNRGHIVQLAPTTSAPVYAVAGPYSFRLVPSDERQAAFLARQLPRGARIGVLYMNTDYGRGLRKALRAALLRRNVSPVFEWSFHPPVDSVQRRVILAQVVTTRPDLLLWIGTPGPLAELLPEIRRQVPTLTVFASDAADANETYSTLRGTLAGLRFVRFIDPEAPDSAMRRLNAQYRAARGSELTYDVVFTYDAVGLLAQALRDGARTREDLRRYLASLGHARPAYVGIGGPITFDSNRTTQRTYQLAEVTAAGVRPLPAR